METRSTTKRKLENLKNNEEQNNKKVAVDPDNSSTTSEEDTSSNATLKASSDEDLSYDSNFDLPDIFSPQAGGNSSQYETPFTYRASRVSAPNVNEASPFPYYFNNQSDLGTPSTPNATTSYYEGEVFLGELFMSPGFDGPSNI